MGLPEDERWMRHALALADSRGGGDGRAEKGFDLIFLLQIGTELERARECGKCRQVGRDGLDI